MNENTTIEEDIEKLEEITDGISDKCQNNAAAFVAINDIQLAIHELKNTIQWNN